MTKITLVRHFKIQKEFTGKYIGHTDCDLDFISQTAIKKTKKKLVKNYNIIYSSDLKRAYKSAKLLGFNQIIRSPNLREINFNKFEKLSYDDIVNKYNIQYNNFADWIKFLELDVDLFLHKIKLFYENLPKNRKILIFTHKGVILAFLSNFEKEKFLNNFFLNINYGDIIEL